MEAITVWQPWAMLIAEGHKPYEFRRWRAPARLVGCRIAIHAGARPVRRAEVLDLIVRMERDGEGSCALRSGAAEALKKVAMFPKSLWLGAIVCTAVLGEPISARETLAEFGAAANDSDRDQHFNFAWPLHDIRRLEPPILARGKQGFWSWR